MKVIDGDIYVWYIVKTKLIGSEGYLELKKLTYEDLLSLKNKYEETPSEKKEQLLQKRVKEYIEALKSGSEDRIYEFFDPYFKELNPLEVWKAIRIKTKFLDAKLINVAYLKGSNVALVTIKAKVKIPKKVLGKFDVERNIKERYMSFHWVFIDGKWYQGVRNLTGYFFGDW